MEKSIESKVCKNESERKEESWRCAGTRVQGKIMFYCVSIQLIFLVCFKSKYQKKFYCGLSK